MIGPEPRTTLRASLHGRNACQHFTRATLYTNLKVKCRRPNARPTLCATLRSRNAHQHFTRATLYKKMTGKNAADQSGPRTQTHTLCEPAQSKCTSTFHKSHFILKFTGKKAADQSEHPDQATAFTATVTTQQCGQTVWRKTRC